MTEEQKGLWRKTKEMTGDAWKGTKNITEDVWEGAKNVTEDVWEGTKNMAGSIKDTFSHNKNDKEASCQASHRKSHKELN